MGFFDNITVYQKDYNTVVADDVIVKSDGGKVTVRSDLTPLSYIQLEVEDNYLDDALVLGDDWERGYGGFEWKKAESTRIMPWYFAAIKENKVYCYGVKTQPNALCSWKCGNGKIQLNIDIRNGSEDIVLSGRSLEACTIVNKVYDCDAFSALQDFCRLMCGSPRLPRFPVYGGNDWYCNYGNNSYEKIITHAKRIVECSPEGNKPFMVIDDGWQLCHQSSVDGDHFNGGPWKYCNDNFADMKMLAGEIVKIGAIPGIWFRPLWTLEKLPDDVVMKRMGITKKLDPSCDMVLNKIKEDVKTIKNWGYKLIKHDFTTFDIFGKWGYEGNMTDTEIHFSDHSKTTAEIIKNMYIAIREAAGDDVIIMGCNTIGHLSAGIFEIQRTGDDTSGIEWERTKKYGINTLAFRMPQHNNFYCADADCVGITNEVPWEKNRQWLDVLSKSGTALFVSIAGDAYTDEIKKELKSAFTRAASNTTASKAIDWIENMLPQKWNSVFGEDQYDW